MNMEVCAGCGHFWDAPANELDRCLHCHCDGGHKCYRSGNVSPIEYLKSLTIETLEAVDNESLRQLKDEKLKTNFLIGRIRMFDNYLKYYLERESEQQHEVNSPESNSGGCKTSSGGRRPVVQIHHPPLDGEMKELKDEWLRLVEEISFGPVDVKIYKVRGKGFRAYVGDKPLHKDTFERLPEMDTIFKLLSDSGYDEY